MAAPAVARPPRQFNPGPYNSGATGPDAISGGWNPFTNRDVYNLYQKMGQNAYQGSQDYGHAQADQADYYGDQAAADTQQVKDLYAPIWNGGGGYTPEQSADIKQTGGLTDLTQGAYVPYDQFQSQYQNEIKPQIGQYAGALQQNVAGGEQKGRDVLGQLKTDYSAAIDPAKLSLSAGYKPGLDATLAKGRSDVNAAQGDPGLSVTPEYLRQAGMSDQEVRDAAESAARGVGAQFSATKDQLDQDAAAAGRDTPLALASARAALDRSSAASQSDALLAARLGARKQQMDAAQNVQNTQLNAGQYRAGLGSQNSLALQNSSIAANTAAEQLRLGANQGLTDRQVGVATNLGQAGLGENQWVTNAAGTALTEGQQAAQGAQERQAGTAAGLQQQGWTNDLNTNTAASTRAKTVADPWVAAQQEGRVAAQGQQQYNAGQKGQAQANQLTGWQLGNQAEQNSAAGYSGWGENQQKTSGAAGILGNIGAATAAVSNLYTPKLPGGKAHGGLIDHHQMIEVGEHDRPEMIIPLDPRTPPDHWNEFERLGARIGEAMGIRVPKNLPHYETGGIVGLDAENPFSEQMEAYTLATKPYANIKGYEQGGVLNTQAAHLPRMMGQRRNDYMVNMGKHHRPLPMPYSEMGRLTHV